MIRNFSVAALLLWSTLALSQSGEQVYFFAQSAPLGSLSREGAAAPAVYLRWDVQEGQLPADLRSFVLTRDRTPIFTAPAAGLMSPAEIQALYDAPAQSRRKAELLRRLSAEAVAEGGGAISPGALGAAVAVRLGRDPLWSFLSSRLDINIARARYRGYVDRPGSGVFRYELLAEDGAGNRRRLGLIEVDTKVQRSVAAAADLQQLIQGRCDAPESALDDGAVSLFWRHGGSGSTDRMANSLQIGGYDLWRSAEPLAAGVKTPPVRDLRAMAAQSAHGAGGELALPGLVKVNDEPILLTGDDSGLITAQYVQQAKETAAAGQRPGTRWAYYVVPRDFSGHYGPAAAVLVEIPDRLTPPAPWRVDTWEQPGGAQLSLEWDAIDLASYMRAHDDGRRYCNASDVAAGKSSRLEYVAAGASCATAPRQTVNLGIGGFRVYRFESFEQASRFSDADGDGVADAVERSADGPGTACDAAAKPANSRSFRVDHPQSAPVQAITTPDRRARLVFRDALPAQDKGVSYWYRLATVGSNGRYSPLSAPVRGFVADRATPVMPAGTVRLVQLPGCPGYETTVSVGKGKNDLRLIDDAGVASRVLARCSNGQTAASFSFARAPDGQRQTLALSPAQCDSLRTACGMVTQLTFMRGDKRFAAATLSDTSECSGTVELSGVENQTRQCHAEPPISEGQALDELPRVIVNTDQCVSLYRDFGRLPGSAVDGSDSYRVGTWCQHNGPVDLRIANPEPGTPICLSAALQNQNARLSPRERLPCFSLNTQQQAPASPTPTGLSFSGNSATAVWLPPQERTSATIIELFRDGERLIPIRRTVPHPGARGDEGLRSVEVELPPPPAGSDWREEWCVRLVAVGQGLAPQVSRVLSEPSPQLCSERIPAGSAPSVYLPWPRIAAPPAMAALNAVYYGDEQALLVRLSTAPLVVEPAEGRSCAPAQPNARQCGLAGDKDAPQRCLDGAPVTQSCPTPVQDSFCRTVRAAAATQIGFVAYRQSRTGGGGEAGDFVQVSPLIDQVHCELTAGPVVGGGRLYLNTLEDPYVHLLQGQNVFGNAWSGLRLAFLDRYPYQRGRDYRYQFVYFDARGEISATRTSDWVSVP